jgi:putative acetyltransferase
MEVTIRPETAADRGAIWEVNERAFGRPNEADLVDALRASDAFLPELSLVAEHDGALVGHILFSRARVDADAGDGLLVLGPIAVRPELQRRGIGGRLIREGLARAAADGHRGVVLIGHPEYYPRFGFLPARQSGLESPYPVSDEAFMALALRPGALEGTRGLIVFPEAFDNA